MAKVIKLKRITSDREQRTEAKSDVYHAVILWIDRRPKNTQRVYLSVMQGWSSWLGADFDQARAGKLWKKATLKDAQSFINDARSRPAQSGRSEQASADGCVSMATIKHKVAVLKSAYEVLIAEGLVTMNPFARLSLEMKRLKAGERRPHLEMGRAELKKFLTFAPLDTEHWRDRAIFHLLFGAALRRSELCTVTLADVLESQAGTLFLRLRQTKAQKLQKIALPDWVADEIGDFKQRRIREGATERDLLFVRYLQRGTEEMGEKFVYRLFKQYCKRFGLNGNYSPHCARVTAITQLLKQGFSHHEVQQLSRHASVVMVERYDRRRYEIDESPSKKLSYDD